MGFIVFLVWPLVEIAGFIIVGREIGVLATLGLLFLSAIIGTVLMRYQGLSALNRVQKDLAENRDPTREAAHGLMIMLAGVLLFLPGFASDIVGMVLFIPPVRDLAWNLLRRRVNITGIRVNRGGFSNRGPQGQTIDLDVTEYTSGPDRDSPWKRVDRDDEGR